MNTNLELADTEQGRNTKARTRAEVAERRAGARGPAPKTCANQRTKNSSRKCRQTQENHTPKQKAKPNTTTKRWQTNTRAQRQGDTSGQSICLNLYHTERFRNLLQTVRAFRQQIRSEQMLTMTLRNDFLFQVRPVYVKLKIFL